MDWAMIELNFYTVTKYCKLIGALLKLFCNLLLHHKDLAAMLKSVLFIIDAVLCHYDKTSVP